MPEFYCIITDIGLSKLAKARTSQENIALAKMAVGDGNGAYYEPNSSQTSLINEKYRFDINRVYIDNINQKQLLIEASVQENAGGFFIREIGVFDEQGDIFAIGKYPVTYKPNNESGSGKDLYIRMAILFSNTPNISLYVNPHSAVASIDTVEVMLDRLKHNSLKNIQGGIVDEYYHLTSSQHNTAESLDKLKLSANIGKKLAVNDTGNGFCVLQSDELFQNMFEVTGNVIEIRDTHSIYKKTISDNIELSFDVSKIENLDKNKSITIELIIDMTTLSTIAFENVKWIDDEAPEMDEEVIYLLVFRSLDGGNNWIGHGQGWISR